MSDQNKIIEKRASTILGDIFFEKNDFSKALEYYVNAGNVGKLKFRGRCFANKGYAAYAAQFLSSAGCALSDERLLEWINAQFDQGRFFHVIEPCVKMGAKEELLNFSEICLKQDQVLMAMIFRDAAGMEFPKDELDDRRRRQLARDIEKYTKIQNPPKHAIKAYSAAGEYSKLLDLSLIYLERNWTTAWSEAYQVAISKWTPPEDVLSDYKEKAAAFAERNLMQGDFKEGMNIFKTIRVKPSKDELIVCGNIGLFSGPIFKHKVFLNSMKALRLAGVTPSKKRVEEAGDCYYANFMVMEAISAYEYAQNADKLWSIMKKYGGKEYCNCTNLRIIERTAQAIAKVEEKISKRKNR